MESIHGQGACRSNYLFSTSKIAGYRKLSKQIFSVYFYFFNAGQSQALAACPLKRIFSSHLLITPVSVHFGFGYEEIFYPSVHSSDSRLADSILATIDSALTVIEPAGDGTPSGRLFGVLSKRQCNAQSDVGNTRAFIGLA